MQCVEHQEADLIGEVGQLHLAVAAEGHRGDLRLALGRRQQPLRRALHRGFHSTPIVQLGSHPPGEERRQPFIPSR